MTDQTPYQMVAHRIAQIANEHARLLSADTYDLPADLRNAIFSACKRDYYGDPLPDNYDIEDKLRKTAAADYLKLELDRLVEEAALVGVPIQAELVTALLPSLAVITEWQSSSMSC